MAKLDNQIKGAWNVIKHERGKLHLIEQICVDLTLRGGYLIQFYTRLTMIFLNSYYSLFYRPPCKLYSNRLLPLLRQFFLTPNIINEFWILDDLLFKSVLPNLITTWRFILFQLRNSNFVLKKTRPRYERLSCMYYNLPKITDRMYIQ
jgi:hypothetical protein